MSKGNLIQRGGREAVRLGALVPSSQVTVITGSATRSDVTCLRVTTAIPGAALARAR
ncbi:hypothetical protein [Streptomyces viridochromogenes]|uniref:hypothetical protein n=1 Tax=Streptomyces viridochromogenes TaxID=1938 RepID=UPI00131E5B9C|nr:hypothetical protein [Streptomyces viridochromogenes]